MQGKLSQINIPNTADPPREGDLYRTVTTFGRPFELRYGYYEECDKESPLCDPVPIYPDFTREPLYTDDGEPFVTMMQDACESYKGEAKRTADTTCEECANFKRGEEWFGICQCPKNKRANE
ncbi:MAG: hypothetical protein IJ011_08995 [Clostridia bacterium]|nr:hypothetical protein [Clostridia bacterium]